MSKHHAKITIKKPFKDESFYPEIKKHSMLDIDVEVIE